jgi:periplasmic copper chaperone A
VQRFNRVISVVSSAALIGVALTGCSEATHHDGKPGISSPGAYVQVPSSTGAATPGYLDLQNNGAADELVSVTSSVGGTVALRAPGAKAGEAVTMHTVSSIPLPSNTTVDLDPTGYHLLLTGEGPMHDGKDIQLTLHFAHAQPLTIYAIVTNPQNGGASYFLN